MEFLCVLKEFLKRGKMVNFRERKLENGCGESGGEEKGKPDFKKAVRRPVRVFL